MSEGRLKLSLCLTLAFVVIEAISGLRANSLALLSDAGHNFTDAFALLLSWYALRVARKPANPEKTYGYHRVGILTALFNALTLIVIAVLIFTEAWRLFQHPQASQGGLMMIVAFFAVIMNTVIAMWLHSASHNSLNMRSAFIHMVGDALSSAGVVAAGAVVWLLKWPYADPLVSVLIGLFIVYSSWGIVSEAINVLLEGTPRGMDMKALVAAMQGVAGVQDVHDLHVWTIGDGMNALSCHLRVEAAETKRAARVIHDVKEMLAQKYEVRHSTIETECDGCDVSELYCSMDAELHTGCTHDH